MERMSGRRREMKMREEEKKVEKKGLKGRKWPVSSSSNWISMRKVTLDTYLL